MCRLGPNKLLVLYPPTEIHLSEELLSRATRCVLTQLRSDNCFLLRNYLFKIKRADDEICPECCISIDFVAHLFQCPTHPTSLTRIDLWKRPVEVADFLSSFPAFSHLPGVPHGLIPFLRFH
jgi:hypothetical protein